MQDSCYLYFDGLAHPVRLTGAAWLLDVFPMVFPDQDYCQGKQDENPIISIVFDAGQYHLSASWLDKVDSYADKVDALCDLIAKLAMARSFTDLEILYLHAASVVMNGRAVVFPSEYRAGKSFLTACLVAEGHRYVGDDVVPLALDTCKVRSSGFSPRLRLPLPGSTDDNARRFIESHTALAGERYAYLGLEQERRVGGNETLDIGAFVLLEREEGAPARLEELPVATVFQQLVKQNFAREIDGGRVLSTLAQTVSNAQCMRLRYDRADEAVSLLTGHFSRWPSHRDSLQPTPVSVDGVNEAPGTTSGECFSRNEQVQKIRIEDEYFLASPDGKAIYYLNTIGSGIWELLAVPTSKEDIIATLQVAFPGIESATIEEDVTKILTKFQLKELVLGKQEYSG